MRIAVFVVALVVVGSCALAQGVGGLGLDVTPVKSDLKLAPGARYNLGMTVGNSSGSSVHVVVTPNDFRVTVKGDYEFLKVGESPYSLMKYASINPREFDLVPGGSQRVRVTFALPSAEPPLSGEYAGVVFFETRPPRGAHAVLNFAARIASKIYSVVPGTAKVLGEIENFTVARAPSGQQVYTVTFKDRGNVHEYIKGYVEVRQQGNAIEKIMLPADALVERGGSRILTADGKILPPGEYDAIAAVDYGAPTLVAGAVKFTVK
ncbi:MAG: hypothetical protein JO101_05020 [Candidatus Eremiobacteraeota bacterium]|nr:hypothetical protein [Candidatus Eremiobacteraeota bacterium]